MNQSTDLVLQILEVLNVMDIEKFYLVLSSLVIVVIIWRLPEIIRAWKLPSQPSHKEPK